MNVIKLLLKLISLFLYRNKSGQNDARDLKMKIREKKLAKIVDGYTSPSRGVEHASTELEKILSIVSFLALKDLHYFAFNSFEC